MSESNDPKLDDVAESTVEQVLTQAGKSKEEIERTSAMDAADRSANDLFRKEASPVHRAIWYGDVDLNMFRVPRLIADPDSQAVMDACVAVARKHLEAGTLYNSRQTAADRFAHAVANICGAGDDTNQMQQIRQAANQYTQEKDSDWHCGRLREEVLQEMGQAGYWGMLIDRQYGGQSAPVGVFMPFLTRVATIDPTLGGLASIHGCIGAVDPVRTFGTDEQKARFLPWLASGEKLSGFALTEPCAGSDLTALRTEAEMEMDTMSPEQLASLPTAELQDGYYLVNGRKLFISNAIYGRIVGLVCKIKDKPAVLIVELPKQDDETFQLIHYGIYALTRTYNKGLVFNNFKVPAFNLLTPKKGDGLTIAYHGLNLGRLALCATAAANVRRQLQSVIPWVKFRRTYGETIGSRELVKEKIGRLASIIVMDDALTAWGSRLLDLGYRGELECVIAKVFGAESQKLAAIDLTMKTHGGRTFLVGNIIGDNLHDLMAPCIYEGVADMLSMAFFKTLIGEFGDDYMAPLGKELAKKNVVQLTKLLASLIGWFGNKYATKVLGHNKKLSGMDKRLAKHVKFAQNHFRKMPLIIAQKMLKHQVKLADKQCLMNEIAQQVMFAVVMLVAALYAHDSKDEATIMAADVIGRELTLQCKGKRPNQKHWDAVARLGQAVLDGKFHQLDNVPSLEILQSYKN